VSRDARLANLLGALATGLVDRVSAASSETAHLDGSAPAALVALLDFSPHGSVHVLSQIVGLTHSGGVRLVDRLVAAGLVERGAGADARSITVSLTRRGRTVAHGIRRERSAEIRDAMVGLTERQRAELVHACEIVIANLTRQRLAERAAGGLPAGGALCRLCDFDACGRLVATCPAASAADPDASTGRR
jgi:MarR family transcriptional regulator, negative regulator of the multidrug operon emrRAB